MEKDTTLSLLDTDWGRARQSNHRRRCAWKRILLVNKERLETFYGKEIIITDRGMVETHAEEILYGADKQDVSLLVVDGLSCSSPTHARNLIRSAIAYVRVIWDWD
ncbi:hypothetical protein EDD15DRAFT_2198853 [Pisolithus albus]|nr:hypothetical protein EDD15DRAFT_2198853 [Pisolithus albus]